MSMRLMSGVERDMDVDIEIAFKGGPSNGTRPRITLFIDHTLWKYFMLKKDLHARSLRRHLLLQHFDFEIRNKG